MVLRYPWPYNGKQYLGNTNTEEVHDLLNEKDACRIDEIRTHHIKMYDSLEDAHRDGLDNCAHCIGGSHH